ncbi:MAG: hypothetical protein OXT09_12710, partial [Myxococcales bacterium]|nr:hypothetical protein [Myxococcales bacterium]
MAERASQMSADEEERRRKNQRVAAARFVEPLRDKLREALAERNRNYSRLQEDIRDATANSTRATVDRRKLTKFLSDPPEKYDVQFKATELLALDAFFAVHGGLYGLLRAHRLLDSLTASDHIVCYMGSVAHKETGGVKTDHISLWDARAIARLRG